MNILFSKRADWERKITRGFWFTRHKIQFDDITPDKLEACDLVVALAVRDLKRLNNFPVLVKDNPIPVPGNECIDLCNDKRLLNETLAKEGFSEFVPKMGLPIAYPYILKKRIGAWGQETHLIANAGHEASWAEAIAHPDYFCQEFILGRSEYATHIIFRQHEIVCALNVKYGFSSETPIKGQDQPTYTRICRCPHIGLFSAILTSIGFQGLCCINYKNVGDHPFILEINPRFGASLGSFFFSFMRQLKHK